jgi:hypothetical protein
VPVIAHKSFDQPCDPIARKTLPRPPHPHPASVTIAIRPSGGVGWREFVEMICPTGEAKYFCNEDWTTQISLRKHNKSPRTRNDIDGYRFRSTHPKRCPTGKLPLSGERTFLVSRTRRSAFWRCAASGTQPGREPINSVWSADVRFGAQNRLKSDIAPGPKKRQKSDISLSGHPKDLSYNSKPTGFYLQPGGAQNLAW